MEDTGSPPRRQKSSTLSGYSLSSDATTVVASPSSPNFQRPVYHRVASVAEEDTSYNGGSITQQDSNSNTGLHGLGISNQGRQKRVSIPRVPVGSKYSPPTTPGSADLLLSPISSTVGGKKYRPIESFNDGEQSENPYNESNLSQHQHFRADSANEPLKDSSSTGETFDTSGHERGFQCRTKKPLKKGRGSWLAVSILVLSVYSTVLSGIWLVIAIIRPRYDQIRDGKLSPSTAISLFAAFAKSVELSFVTVFVAFLGQVLSTRALMGRNGMSIAAMSMRSWILQPGTMMTNWESVRYAANTFLGILALLAALMSMIYTVASQALVAPALSFGQTEHRLIYGTVATKFANPDYIMNNCNTPISQSVDPEEGPRTCIQIEHSGQAYHNYMQYLTLWVDSIDSGNGSDALLERPDPVGMLYDNTTLRGSWTNVHNMTALSNKYGRTVDNVTMAMPHAGVVAAVMDPINGLTQPQDLSVSILLNMIHRRKVRSDILQGMGEYYMKASVPSPSINVLCANMSSDELKPMVYAQWPSEYLNGTLPNATNWPAGFNLTTPSPLVHTTVDDLFGFNENETHPLFPKLPLPYNTVFNTSNVYGHVAVYLLATSASETYTMCSLKAALSPDCSTELHATGTGGFLSSRCEDPDDHLAYKRSEPNASNGMWVKDWVNVASMWGLGLSLNTGIIDGNSANARLLTQLIPTSAALDPALPSIAEALAVLAGCTLVISSLDSPFIPTWNYSATTLNNPQYQAFNATLRTRVYASGGDTEHWQGIFYIVLLSVFCINVICLIYFIVNGSHVTDFVDPQNLFLLSLNSPPSAVLDGSCGGGLEKEQLRANWQIALDREREHWFIESKDTARNFSEHANSEVEGSPVVRMYSKLRRKRKSLL